MSGQDQLEHLTLHDRQAALGAAFGPEAGFEVPLSYQGPAEEAAMVRESAGLFDLTHHGRIRVRGDQAADALDMLCSAGAFRQEDDTIRPTLVCNQRGGIVDLCRLVRLEDSWLLITSPGGRSGVLENLEALKSGLSFKIEDQTSKSVLLAAFGPAAAKRLSAVLPVKVSDMPPEAVKTGSVLIARYVAARFDIGGLWGICVTVPNMLAGAAWDFLVRKAGNNAITPAGMAAWDIIRIEAGHVRRGHEINETIDPLTAGLENLIDFNHDFTGREAVGAIRSRGQARVRVGLVFAADAGGEAIPRLGSAIFDRHGREIGAVTSGTYSTALKKTVAMAYISRESAEAGTALVVDTPSGRRDAAVAALPFY